MGDHTGSFGINTLNKLLADLNVSIRQNADAATFDYDTCPPLTDITPDQLTSGVSSLDFLASSSLSFNPLIAKSLVRV